MTNLTHHQTKMISAARRDAYNGGFGLVVPITRATLHVIATDSGLWDHVSVAVAGKRRCPFWSEMAWVKDQFALVGTVRADPDYVSGEQHEQDRTQPDTWRTVPAFNAR